MREEQINDTMKLSSLVVRREKKDNMKKAMAELKKKKEVSTLKQIRSD